MKDIIEFGIGFVTGRPNVCKLINSYYKNMIEQITNIDKQVNITIFNYMIWIINLLKEQIFMV